MAVCQPSDHGAGLDRQEDRPAFSRGPATHLTQNRPLARGNLHRSSLIRPGPPPRLRGFNSLNALRPDASPYPREVDCAWLGQKLRLSHLYLREPHFLQDHLQHGLRYRSGTICRCSIDSDSPNSSSSAALLWNDKLSQRCLRHPV